MAAKTQAIGYWTFFCSPAKWQIDEFLRLGKEQDDYMIADWQAGWFRPGHLGVVRVGVDKRTREQLGHKTRLRPGVYAIVAIAGEPRRRSDGDEFWLDGPPETGERQAVDIRYLKSLLSRPLLLEVLKSDTAITDRYLLDGFQAASMPLDAGTFDRIVERSGCGPDLFENLEAESTDSAAAIAALERRYAEAAPQVKEVISRRIERGPVAARVKKVMGYECQVCKAQGVDAIGFRKRSGEPYVEAHHVTFVSTLEPGSLGPSNLITVCANHHRQLHLGNAELIRNTELEFVFRIDDDTVRVPKVTAEGIDSR